MEDAARALLLERGFDDTTMEAVANAARVAVPTVYAAFGSKIGIVRAVLDRARFGVGYRQLIARALGEPSPVARLAYAAQIAREVYDAERAEVELLTSAGALSPEIARMEQATETGRYEAQASLVQLLAAAGVLRVAEREARDLLWALTGRDLYRRLVVERGWKSAAYERWLSHQLEATLLEPSPDARAAPPAAAAAPRRRQRRRD
jgi:AcrR family transcriptional regulator